MSIIVLVSLKGTREKARIAKAKDFSQTVNHVIGAYAVGIWKFDEGSGSIANDSSGYGNNGTIYGATRVAGILGSALSFDGVDDYVEAPVLTPSYVTVEAWINMTSVITEYPRVVSNVKYEAPTYKGFEIYQGLDTRDIGMQINVGGTFYSVFVGTPNLGTWTHVAFTFDGSYIRPYFNGVAASPQAAAGTITYHSAPEKTYIGKNPNIGAVFNGLIDEVRVYNRALTAAEIQQHYSFGARRLKLATPDPLPNESALVGYWTFNGKDTILNSTTTDMSGNGNDGRMGSTASTSADAADPTPIAGVIGQALSFDGVDDYVNAGNGASLDITSAITLEAWVNNQTTLTGWRMFIDKRNSYSMGVSGGTGFTFWYYDGTTWRQPTTYTIPSNEWLHLVATQESTDGGANTLVKLYVNGALVRSQTLTGRPTTTSR
ncbi:MAG: LamG domain-containing protein, partial [Candidatus Berkelbacteria bacterium]|nr:LamG domain-containing protein [Candidatus Berkelbacteria bacterium]